MLPTKLSLNLMCFSLNKTLNLYKFVWKHLYNFFFKVRMFYTLKCLSNLTRNSF